LAADGVDSVSLKKVMKALEGKGAFVEVIASKQGSIIAENDEQITVQQSFLTAASVLYDAVYVPGGTNSVATLEAEPDAVHFLNEAFKHCKAIAADTAAIQVLEATYFFKKLPPDYSTESVMSEGIVVGNNAGKLAELFISAIAMHRFWEREKPRKVPA
ncbi:MAG: catalase HPII, partial [Pedobacter sp.]